MKQTMLSTKDNPFNPFTQFEQWLTFDINAGYNTCGYLARIVKMSDDISEEDESLSIDQAIDEIISLNITGNYIKVVEE